MGARDLSNEGSTFYESPNIDRIANEGMKFTRGYATCQVCSPSRASILTGKYPTNHGITTWIGDRAGEAWRGANRSDSHLPPEYERNLRASEITLAEAMKEAGYKTFFAGKWHLGSEGSGQRIMDLISIRVAGMWAVHGVASSLPTLTQIWNPVRTGNLLPSGSAKKRPILLKLIRISPFWLIYPLHRPCSYSDDSRTLEKIPGQSRKNGTYKCQGTLSFRPSAQCPSGTGLPDLCGYD